MATANVSLNFGAIAFDLILDGASSWVLTKGSLTNPDAPRPKLRYLRSTFTCLVDLLHSLLYIYLHNSR